MAAISHVFTISRAAEMLGEDKDWLADLAMVLDPEDGRMTVYDINERPTTAFTTLGIENLRQLVLDLKGRTGLPPSRR